jgi:glyoxylase-like metal-dependent hydrolase (beta-lactamase superfamily II)
LPFGDETFFAQRTQHGFCPFQIGSEIQMKTLVFVHGLLCLAVTATAQNSGGNPKGALQGPDHYSFRVGDIEITSLSDGTVPQDLHALLHNTTDAKTDALLHDAFLANPVEASINAFLFHDAGHTVLVDTGSGDFFGPGYGGKLLESLASIHVSPDQITDVLLTHAHDDHMGGLVHNGNLVFPRAIVHLSAPDLAFFMDRSNSAKAHYAMSYFDQAFTALKPELNAGKIVTFHSEEEVLPGVEAVIHPGHTPGSTFYILHSHGESITFTGDIIHVAAVQAPDPEITIAYDVDPAKAALVREEALAQFAKERTLVAVPHLPFPGVGHFRKNGEGYTWVPILYQNRDFRKDQTFMDPHRNGDRPE